MRPDLFVPSPLPPPAPHLPRSRAVALFRNRKFADSPQEETVRCELVSAVGPDSRPDEYLESIKKGVERRFPASFVL